MSVGRNDPCPCGSGEKYKRCCLPRDRTATPPASAGPMGGGPRPRLTGEMKASAQAAAAWEAAVFPVPISLGDDPDARPAACLVVAGGVVVHTELVSHPVNEVEDIVLILEDGVLEGAEAVGAFPLTVRVRYPEVADALHDRIAHRGIQVDEAPRLPELEHAARSLVEHLAGEGFWPPMAAPRTWAGWGHPEEAVARLFQAAAAFHRAEPWNRLPDDRAVRLAFSGDDGPAGGEPDGVEWAASIMGGGGETFGLALYEDEDDLYGMALGPEGPFPGLEGLRGPVLSVSFDDANDIPRSMRREVARAGWEVAATDAYPVLVVLNTPGGGVTRERWTRLRDALAALARLAEAVHAGETTPPGPGREDFWRDPDTGVRVWMDVIEDPWDIPWPWPEEMNPGGPEGSGADPEAALDPTLDTDEILREHEAILDAFAHHLEEDKGFSPATVERHLDNAEDFLGFLATFQGVPLPAVHELDLRLFLYDWSIRKRRGPAGLDRALPTSLGHLFRFLAEREDLRFPWAGPILKDRDSLDERRETFPGGFFWSPGVSEWISVVWEDLGRRLMTPDPGLGPDGDAWAGEMGPEEAALQDELQRRWLVWREEWIRRGVREPEELYGRLLEAQRAWESSPDPDEGGPTPHQVVRAERARMRGDGPG